ncbi:MAG: ACT domain-containing protein [Candidatus Anammoximicrobium sp.]|nr:ACT domain-containing protein [Candidatus Anammoximicrobium sp.]
MIARQLSVFLENKPGVLAAVCKALGDHDINIRGVSVSDTVDHAVVRLIVSDPYKAVHVLGEHGALVVETDVLVVKLPDHPGALAQVAAKFARGKINIEYAYGSSDDTEATVFMRVSDTKRAAEILTPKKKPKK